jgi:hypothetical protein
MCVFKVSEKHFTTYNEKKEKRKNVWLFVVNYCLLCL